MSINQAFNQDAIGNGTANQGSANTAANAWPTKLTDGTNTTAVKAASTAATATDPSAVVALSPNSPVPTGSNNIGSITNITGTVSLPTGASTSALQTSGNSSLSSIDTKTPALGQAAMSASVPVALASNQTGINTFLDKSGTGTITALNAGVTATTNGASSVNFSITGTWVATVAFDGSTDNGLSYNPIIGDVISVFGAAAHVPASSLTVPGLVTVSAGSFTHVKIRASAYTSGTINVAWTSSAGLQTLQVYNTSASAFLATVTQGTSPWVDNISQFGGTNISTGTGVGGAGIPRVTVSTDSFSSASLATSTKQSDGSQKTQVVDGSGNVAPAGDTAARRSFTQGTDGTNSQGYTASSEAKVLVSLIALTGSSPANATVGITSASAISANSSRKGLIVINTSINTISLNVVGGAAVLNSGITLYPGGVWNMDQFSFTTAAIFAIASAASSNLSIQEFA